LIGSIVLELTAALGLDGVAGYAGDARYLARGCMRQAREHPRERGALLTLAQRPRGLCHVLDRDGEGVRVWILSSGSLEDLAGIHRRVGAPSPKTSARRRGVAV
jgi:hypothetical protein